MAKVVRLSITQTERGDYQVVVSGEGFEDAEGREVGVRLRGEDEWFDDSISATFLNSNIIGGIFSLSTYIPGSALNEDWGEDEIYAIANVEGFGEFRSNTIRRHF